MDWKGVIVKDSLVDLSIMNHLGIIKTYQKELGISGIWNIIEVIVSDDKINKVVELLENKCLAPAWYAVFKKSDRAIIVFRGKHFNIDVHSKRSLTEVKNWAFKKYNILPSVFTLNI